MDHTDTAVAATTVHTTSVVSSVVGSVIMVRVVSVSMCSVDSVGGVVVHIHMAHAAGVISD